MNHFKKIGLGIITFLFIQQTAIAQENNSPQTLLGNTNAISKEDLGYFVAPGIGLTQMDGSLTSLFHLRSGLSFKEKLSLGAFFNTSLNRINPISETLPNIYMDYWTVGGFVEYTAYSQKLIHLTFPIFMGYGEVEMDNETGDAGLGESHFFQLEPSALIEVNISKFVRFNIGGGYRFVGPMNYRNFDHNAISGPTGYIGLNVGLFR